MPYIAAWELRKLLFQSHHTQELVDAGIRFGGILRSNQQTPPVPQVARRNDLKKYLLKNGNSTAVHYPIPIHLQPASKFLHYNKGSFPMAEMQAKKILTLPINQFLKVREIYNICKHINKFYSKK